MALQAQPSADSKPLSPQSAHALLLSVPPRTWAFDAANNEIPVIDHPGQYLRYRMHVIDAKGDQLRDVIESKDGTVARLIERDGRALTEDEDKWEQQRLNDMIAAPDKYKRHVSGDVSGKKRAVELIKMLPDAMVFSYAPGQPQLPDFPGEQVVLDYKPNPGWHPPTTTSEALTGLAGRVWIDARTHHMVRMEGDIFQGVNLGWGMLAHIYPGGKLMLQQTPTQNDPNTRWIFSHFTEQLTVRALMLKTFRENSRVSSEGYTPVPAMPYQEAIKTLLATPLPKPATVALKQQ
ncbi:hypothetical protein SAMN05421771_4282 [Granulicella pectinivorans]|jgi:hypothetical protein|uniref:Uncharacterized protein n=1 Tax=Granulicella pectinivorans TaxID=474950 RepID=A0A1I6N1K0_9BACT|nr:hypothetical protein SAMN05421771_4282 [Granulicella pectinivorans]